MASFVVACCHLSLWSMLLECICYNDSGASVTASCKEMALLTRDHICTTKKLRLLFRLRGSPIQFPRALKTPTKSSSFLFALHIRHLAVRIETSPAELPRSLYRVIASLRNLRRLRCLEIEFRGCPRASLFLVDEVLTHYFSSISIYQLRQLSVVLCVTAGITEKLARSSMGTFMGLYDSQLPDLMKSMLALHKPCALRFVYRGQIIETATNA